MSSLLHRGRASYAFFERNWNLTKRYWAWEVVWLVYNIVNAMAVTYIGAAAQLITKTKVDTNYLIMYLLIGTAVWSYLSVTFEGVTDMITIERWEGTIEHTLMTPVPRVVHLVSMAIFGVAHAIVRATARAEDVKQIQPVPDLMRGGSAEIIGPSGCPYVAEGGVVNRDAIR